MPVNVETPIATSTANGVTTVFPYSFTILQASDLIVTATDTSGAVTTYTLNVDYTLSGVGTASGSVDFGIAPANGLIITRYRSSALARSTDYQQNGDLPSDTLDRDFDRLWMALQEFLRNSGSALRVPEAAGVAPFPAIQSRLDAMMAFDPITGGPITTAFTASQVAAAVAAAGRLSFPIDFAIDAATYAAGGMSIYGGTVDCAAAINAALSVNQRVQISGIALIKSQIVVPTGKSITMLPGAAIVLDTAFFTGARNTSTGVGLLFNGNSGGGIFGGAIYPSTYVDDRALCAIRAVSASRVRIDGVDFSNYSKCNGIVSIDTGTDCAVTNCIFRDCTTNSATTGQLTGVTVDDNRIGGVSSLRTKIIGNTFRDLTVGASFLALYGYQTDGCTIEVGTLQTIFANNEVFNVGEGIDCWGLNGAITGNTFRHCYNFGIKLVHSASYNTVVGNSVYDSGLAGITAQGASSDTTDTAYNVIADNLIAGIDAAGAWSASTTGCILISDGTGTTFIPRNNVFSGNFLNPGPGGKYCIVRSASTDASNTFPNTHFVAAGSVGYVSDNANSMGRITALNRTLMRANVVTAQTITALTAAKIQLATRTFDDRNEFDAVTNYRWTCQIPGLYRVIGQVTLGAVGGTGKIGLLEIRLNGGVATASHALMTGTASYSIDDLIACKTGDYVELWYTNGDTSNVSANNGPTNTFMTIQQA
jgi:parallel beta-helix repeat protein